MGQRWQGCPFAKRAGGADACGARGAAQTQVIINCGALPCLLNLLQTSHKKSIKKEACWTISNITAGTKDQIQAVIDSHILPPLVQVRRTLRALCYFGLGVCRKAGMGCLAKKSVGCGDSVAARVDAPRAVLLFVRVCKGV